jgi:glycosyltransferase involved in cell wall biosynthesis
LIPARDRAALASALRALANDAALRDQFGQAARTTIEQEFSSLAMARQYLSHYRQIRHTKQEAA